MIVFYFFLFHLFGTIINVHNLRRRWGLEKSLSRGIRYCKN